jgi:hypothetical protein
MALRSGEHAVVLVPYANALEPHGASGSAGT